jgi:hypothetical protein
VDEFLTEGRFEMRLARTAYKGVAGEKKERRSVGVKTKALHGEDGCRQKSDAGGEKGEREHKRVKRNASFPSWNEHANLDRSTARDLGWWRALETTLISARPLLKFRAR